MIFGVKQLKTLDDWRHVVSDRNWVEGRSAQELALKWHPAVGFPQRVADLLNTTSLPALQGLHRDYLIVEMPTFLDTYKAPSWTDLMVYAHNAQGQPVIIGVEGKADEPFADRVCFWVRDSHNLQDSPKKTRLSRLAFLSRVLRAAVEPDSTLRYQLLHRTAATLLEAEKMGADSAVVLVHSFDDSSPDNWNDYSLFLDHLSLGDPDKTRLAGPVSLGHDIDIATFFGWVQDAKT